MSDDFEEDGRGNPRQNSTWLQIRVSTALDPRNMTQMLTLMQLLESCTAGNEFQANKVIVLKSNLNNFCRIMAVNKNEFLDFNVKVTLLDDFLAFYVFSSSLYKDFWYVCNFILSLCHGQSSVERRFNVNQQTMMKNLEELGLTSLKNCL